MGENFTKTLSLSCLQISVHADLAKDFLFAVDIGHTDISHTIGDVFTFSLVVSAILSEGPRESSDHGV